MNKKYTLKNDGFGDYCWAPCQFRLRPPYSPVVASVYIVSPSDGIVM